MSTTKHSPAIQLILKAEAQPPPELPIPRTAERQAHDLIGRLLQIAKCVADGHEFNEDEASIARDTLADPYFAKAREWHARHDAAYRARAYDTEPLTDEDVATLDRLGL